MRRWKFDRLRVAARFSGPGIRFLRLHARGSSGATQARSAALAAQQRAQEELTAEQQERRTTSDRVKVQTVLFHSWGGERFQRVRCLRHIRYAARGA
jgi:hypothetical protein